MTEIYFLIRHTPFWAIPLVIITGEFTYLFWLRKKKTNMKICIIFMIVSLVAIGWYYYAGGPDKAVRKFMKWHRNLDF